MLVQVVSFPGKMKTAKVFDVDIHEVSFSKSFRSDELILDFIDGVFQTINKQGIDYFCENNLKHISNKNFKHASIEIWPLVLGKAEGSRDKNSYDWDIIDSYEKQYEQQQVLANMIANKIQILIASGAFSPSDFMILVRKRDILIDYIIQALKERQIPVSGIDRLFLNTNIAVKDLLALMQFIVLPEDDYNLACLLKSSIFAISEDDLLLLCQRESRSLWENLSLLAEQSKVFQDIYSVLKTIITNIEIHSPYQLTSYCLDISGYRKNFVSRHGLRIN